MFNWQEDAHFGGVLWFYGILTNFFKEKSGKRALAIFIMSFLPFGGVE